MMIFVKKREQLNIKQYLVLILTIIVQFKLYLTLSPGMQQDRIFIEQNNLLQSQLVSNDDVGDQSGNSYKIVGEFQEGISAIVYKNTNQRPITKFIRSGQIVSEEPSQEISSLTVLNLDACKINNSWLLVVYSAKTIQKLDLDIYISVIDIKGNVIYQDFLIEDYNNTDQDFPKCLNTEKDDIMFLVWQSYNQDEIDSIGIFSKNIKISTTGQQPEIIGNTIQVNTHNTIGDQMLPNLYLLRNQDPLSTEPRKIVVSYQGQGDIYSYLQKQYYTYQQVVDYIDEEQLNNFFDINIDSVNLIKENNQLGFYTFFMFQDDRYVGLQIEYPILQTLFINKNFSNNQIFSNIKVVDQLNLNQIQFYFNSDILGICLVSYEYKDGQIDNEIIINTNYNIMQSNTDYDIQLLAARDRLFILKQMKNDDDEYFTNKISLYLDQNNKKFKVYQGELWLNINIINSIHSPQLCFSISSYSQSVSLLQLGNDNQFYYSEYFYEEFKACNIPNCDVCYLNESNQEVCQYCKGSDQYWRQVRMDENQLCTCKQEFNDNPLELDCKPICVSYCDTCNQHPRDCIQCSTGIQNRSETLPCKCEDKYYDENDTCQLCVFPCDTCIGLDICTTCIVGQDRDTNPPCQCLLGFYENESNQCIQCNNKCITCIQDLYCTSCGINRILTASQYCICDEQHYENEDGECVGCHFPCKTCSDKNTCITCIPDNSIIVGGICSCLPGYYLEQQTQQCEQCPQYCKTCTSNSSCDTCYFSSPQRIPIEKCSCQVGFSNQENSTQCIDNNQISSEVIQPNNSCNQQCKQCNQNQTHCELCQDSEPVRDLNNFCKCIIGYIESSDGISCIIDESTQQKPNKSQEQEIKKKEKIDNSSKDRETTMQMGVIILAGFLLIIIMVYKFASCYLKKQKQLEYSENKPIENGIAVEDLNDSFNKNQKSVNKSVNNTHTNLLIQQTAIGETLKTEMFNGQIQNKEDIQIENNDQQNNVQGNKRNRRRNNQGITTTMHPDYDINLTEYQQNQIDINNEQQDYQIQQDINSQYIQNFDQQQINLENQSQNQITDNGHMSISFREGNQNDNNMINSQIEEGNNYQNDEQQNNHLNIDQNTNENIQDNDFDNENLNENEQENIQQNNYNNENINNQDDQNNNNFNQDEINDQDDQNLQNYQNNEGDNDNQDNIQDDDFQQDNLNENQNNNDYYQNNENNNDNLQNNEINNDDQQYNEMNQQIQQINDDKLNNLQDNENDISNNSDQETMQNQNNNGNYQENNNNNEENMQNEVDDNNQKQQQNQQCDDQYDDQNNDQNDTDQNQNNEEEVNNQNDQQNLYESQYQKQNNINDQYQEDQNNNEHYQENNNEDYDKEIYQEDLKQQENNENQDIQQEQNNYQNQNDDIQFE